MRLTIFMWVLAVCAAGAQAELSFSVSLNDFDGTSGSVRVSVEGLPGDDLNATAYRVPIEFFGVAAEDLEITSHTPLSGFFTLPGSVQTSDNGPLLALPVNVPASGVVEFNAIALGSAIPIASGVEIPVFDFAFTASSLGPLDISVVLEGYLSQNLLGFDDDSFQFRPGIPSPTSGTLELYVGDSSGDFNGDRAWDCADIDPLVAEIVAGTNTGLFDLTADGLVDAADLAAWLGLAGQVNLPSGNPYLPGDADLSGAVDLTDFDIWNSNRFTSNPAWCQGDFNADGAIDLSDFNLWNTSKFSSSAVAVPEPSAGGILGGLFCWLLIRSRWHGRIIRFRGGPQAGFLSSDR